MILAHPNYCTRYVGIKVTDLKVGVADTEPQGPSFPLPMTAVQPNRVKAFTMSLDFWTGMSTNILALHRLRLRLDWYMIWLADYLDPKAGRR